MSQKERNRKPALERHKEILDVIKAEKELEEARQEWDQTDVFVTGYSKPSYPLLPVTYEEALYYFRNKDLSQYMQLIKPTIRRRGLSALFHYLFGPPKLHPDLIQERNLVFAIAQCHFDSKEPLHGRILQTLYQHLTGIKINCPRYGSHWEEIGFQGTDPSTDLRGTGLFALLQLLFFVLCPKTVDLAKEIYKLSRHKTQNFPFCVMSINVTRISLQILREEALNRLCNTRNELIPIVNELYCGIFLHLYQIWKDQKKTIVDSGNVLKEVTRYAKRNILIVIQSVQNGWKKEVAASEQQAGDASKKTPVEFKGVDAIAEETAATNSSPSKEGQDNE